MSTVPNPANPNSFFREPAKVRVASRWPWSQSDFRSAYVLVSSRIYWKVANEDQTNKPQSFSDFRNEHSLELVRLSDEKTWADDDCDVKVDNHNGRRRITVCGRPHGRTRRIYGLHGGNVRIEILSNTPEQVQVWTKQIRARVVPWIVLEREVKDAAMGVRSPSVEELEEVLGVLVDRYNATEPSSTSTGEAEGKWSKLPENMAKLSIVEKLTTHAAGAVGSGAGFVTLVARAQSVADTAKLIGDLSKFATGVSSIFHLVSLGAQGISMCVEAKRGQKVLPIALDGMSIILEYVLNSITEVMMPSRGVHDTNIEFVLDALRQTVCTMDKAETQYLRGRGNQILNAGDVKEVEKQLGQLRHMAVTAGNTSWICTVKEKLCQLEKQLKTYGNGVHHVRPSLSAFFSGRKQELSKLEKILEKWGSAVIAQYGGVGKTELMIAFADRAQREEVVPGGIFWVTVHGGEKNMIESLARLAEKLTSRTMDEEERRNGNLVVAALKQGLGLREGRWLLCLDNADDSEVSGILNEVCGMTVGPQGNGWIVVTSRQGQPHVWSRMKSEQRLILEPLCEKDAMVALWRQIRKIETSASDDDAVLKDIKEFEKANTADYRALKELCGDDGACSLGGLPLALVQAGTYIARFKCSFSEYLEMFKNANRKEDMQDIMRSTEDVKLIRKSQRSIWTTWKISVEQLSAEAFTVLRAMAMLGPGGVGEGMVKKIMEGVASNEGKSADWMFRKVVIDELIHGSSLIFQKEEGQAEVYKMHQLVQRFIVSDMERGSGVWNRVYSLALVCVHEAVETELEMTGKSFERLPAVFDNNHREIAAHAIALVQHLTLPAQDIEIQDVSQVEDIHRYAGSAMEFLGKLEKELQVWESLVQALEHQQVADRSRSCIQRSLEERKREKSHIASAYDSLGNALMRTGKFNSANSKLEKSLEVYLQIYGPNEPHPSIAAPLDNLGLLYKAMGKLEKALEHHEKSLQMKLAIYGSDEPHPSIATSLNNLGRVYNAMGKLDKALEYYEKSLQMDLAIHGSDKPHPSIAASLDNLGRLYKAMGKLGKALEHHEKSLQMKLAIHGCDKPHPSIAASLNNLGRLYKAMGKLDRALEYHEKSLKMDMAIYGSDKPHPSIAASLDNLGRLYKAMGELDKALEHHEKSLQMALAIHGSKEPHPSIATSLNNLGLLYEAIGRLDKAMEYHRKSLQMDLAIHGSDKPRPSIAASLNNIGLLYESMGKLGEALEYHEKSLQMYLAIHGSDKPHPSIATLLNNLGWLYKAMGKLDKALEYHRKSLQMYLAIHGFDKPHPSVAASLNNLGLLYQAMGKLDKALEHHEKSLKMKLAIHGSDKPHPSIATSFKNLGLLYQAMDELGKALEHHEKSLQMYLAIHGSDKPHPSIAASLNNLGRLYEEMGKLNTSLEHHEKALEMYRAITNPDKLDDNVARSLFHIGIVQHKLKNLDLAAKVLEQSLEILRTVHSENSVHPLITKLLSLLSDVYQDRRRQDEASAMHEGNKGTEKASHGLSSNPGSEN